MLSRLALPVTALALLVGTTLFPTAMGRVLTPQDLTPVLFLPPGS